MANKKKAKRVPKLSEPSKRPIVVPPDDMKALFDGLMEARDSMAILVRALYGQNCEYDDIFADRLQRQGVWALEKQMGAIEKMANVEEGEWFTSQKYAGRAEDGDYAPE